MKRYQVPQQFQKKLFGDIDPRFCRALWVTSILGIVVAVSLSVIPRGEVKVKPRRLVPKERLARVLIPKKPAPPRKVQAPPAKPLPKQLPRVAKLKKPAQQTKVKARPRKKPSPNQVRRGQRRAARDPNVGKAGREAGQRVAKEVRKATRSIDNLLSSMSGTLPVLAPVGDGGGRAKRKQVYALAGGRGAKQLASIKGALDGQGAGRGGTSRGVSNGGVDIVAQDVESSGDDSALWGRDSRSLMAIVQRYKAGVKFCYDNALKKTSGLHGKITLQMDINASGAVRNLKVVSDTMNNRSLQRCIQSQVRNWRFQRIDEGTVRFTLPLVFSPPNG